jgi:hypothetical protein
MTRVFDAELMQTSSAMLASRMTNFVTRLCRRFPS